MGCVAQNSSAGLFYLKILSLPAAQVNINQVLPSVGFCWPLEGGSSLILFYFFLFSTLLWWRSAHITAGIECFSSGVSYLKNATTLQGRKRASFQFTICSTVIVHNIYWFQIFAISAIIKCSNISTQISALGLNFFTFKLDLLFLGRKIYIL